MPSHSGSASRRLENLTVGERTYIETTLERWDRDMRVASVPRTRRPPSLAGREFTATVFTALGSRLGEIRYLICIERHI